LVPVGLLVPWNVGKYVGDMLMLGLGDAVGARVGENVEDPTPYTTMPPLTDEL